MMSRRSCRRPRYLRQKQDTAAGLVLLAVSVMFAIVAFAAMFAWAGYPLGE